MEEKKAKKRFWASLFSPKPCCCSCDDNIIVEEEEKPKSECCCEECCEGDAGATKGNVKEIKVLGPGCSKCVTTFEAVQRVVKENNLDVKLTKVEDIAEIMTYNIMTTPAVVVDGVVKIKGRVPSESEIKELLGI